MSNEKPDDTEARIIIKEPIECPLHGELGSFEITYTAGEEDETTGVCPRCVYEAAIDGVRRYQERQLLLKEKPTERVDIETPRGLHISGDGVITAEGDLALYAESGLSRRNVRADPDPDPDPDPDLDIRADKGGE